MKTLKKLFVGLVKLGVVGFLVFTIVVIVRNIEADKWSKLLDETRALIPKEVPKERVEDTIYRVCNEEGVPWRECILVAWEESELNPYFTKEIRTGIYKGSLDRGIFALNNDKRTFGKYSDEEAYNVEMATRIFCAEYKKGNARKWLVYSLIK